MSIVEVAKLAGVSTATVSRVLNNSPVVSAETAEAVRRVMAQTKFARRRAPRRTSAAMGQTKVASLAFLMFGPASSRGPQPVYFEELFRGISSATTKRDIEISFAFIPDDGELPKRVLQGNVDGLLLHGQQPADSIRPLIERIPTVWLMSNLQRAPWGDQIMPDNTAVGEIAANYLVRRGHRRLAFVNLVWRSWFWALRARSFLNQGQALGADVSILPDEFLDVPPEARANPQSAAEIVDRLVGLKPRPTGLFIAEDFQVPQIAAELHKRGLRTGPDADFEIVSCNHEPVHFSTLGYSPATIDVQAEAIGRRGVEMLLARIQDPGPERIRILVEPLLVPPAG